VSRAAGLLEDMLNLHFLRFLALSQQKLQNICCVCSRGTNRDSLNRRWCFVVASYITLCPHIPVVFKVGQQ